MFYIYIAYGWPAGASVQGGVGPTCICSLTAVKGVYSKTTQDRRYCLQQQNNRKSTLTNDPKCLEGLRSARGHFADVRNDNDGVLSWERHDNRIVSMSSLPKSPSCQRARFAKAAGRAGGRVGRAAKSLRVPGAAAELRGTRWCCGLVPVGFRIEWITPGRQGHRLQKGCLCDGLGCWLLSSAPPVPFSSAHKHCIPSTSVCPCVPPTAVSISLQFPQASPACYDLGSGSGSGTKFGSRKAAIRAVTFLRLWPQPTGASLGRGKS